MLQDSNKCSAHYLTPSTHVCLRGLVGRFHFAPFFVVAVIVCNANTVHNHKTQVLNEASALLFFFPVAFSRGEGHLDARGKIEAREEEGRVQFICKARY